MRTPSLAVVTVQPSWVVAGFAVLAGALLVIRLAGGVTDGVVVTLGSGVGKVPAVAAGAGSRAGAASGGVAVRSTGVNATDASAMLVAVAAHHPAIGAHREDRTRPIVSLHSMVDAMALILLVEDDRNITAALSRALSDAGHVVRAVGRAADALRTVTEARPDLVVLDLGLPDADGTEVLRMMRSMSDVPVIVATARRSEADIIALLSAGADDYVTKPFSGGHILARIAAVLRRARTTVPGEPSAITVADLVIHPRQRRASLAGRPLQLTRREFDVLAYLAERTGQVISRRELMNQVWNQARIGEEQTIDVHISWLRRKLGETAARPRFLHTVRGVGVMMVDPR